MGSAGPCSSSAGPWASSALGGISSTVIETVLALPSRQMPNSAFSPGFIAATVSRSCSLLVTCWPFRLVMMSPACMPAFVAGPSAMRLLHQHALALEFEALGHPRRRGPGGRCPGSRG